MLVENGSNINLQTGSGKANVTALMIGAMMGNLDVVKTCVELGGGADIRGTLFTCKFIEIFQPIRVCLRFDDVIYACVL